MNDRAVVVGGQEGFRAAGRLDQEAAASRLRDGAGQPTDTSSLSDVLTGPCWLKRISERVERHKFCFQ